jgi:hypothetical protein
VRRLGRAPRWLDDLAIVVCRLECLACGLELLHVESWVGVDVPSGPPAGWRCPLCDGELVNLGEVEFDR